MTDKQIKAKIKEIEAKYGIRLGYNKGREWDNYRTKFFKPSGVKGDVDTRLPKDKRTHFIRNDAHFQSIQKEINEAGQEVAGLRQRLKDNKQLDKQIKGKEFQLKLLKRDNRSLLSLARKTLSRKTVDGGNRFVQQRTAFVNEKQKELDQLKIQRNQPISTNSTKKPEVKTEYKGWDWNQDTEVNKIDNIIKNQDTKVNNQSLTIPVSKNKDHMPINNNNKELSIVK
jgi:hypothetical protein